MAKFLDALAKRPATESRYTLDDYANWLLESFNYGGFSYPLTQTMSGQDTEPIGSNFVGHVEGALKNNGAVAALELVRVEVFSQARFQWQPFRGGRPQAVFGTPELALLEKPWTGGTTGNLLARMILDADTAGNYYGYRDQSELVRLRPDYTDILLVPRETRRGKVGYKRAGYAYYEDGQRSQKPSAVFLPDEIAHWAPMPDPLAEYRGMSWLTPVLREIQGDTAYTRHKLKFVDNAATPNLAVTLAKEVTPDQFEMFVEMMDAGHKGIANAYKCLHPSTEVAMWDGQRLRADEVRERDVVVAWSDGRAVPGFVSAAEVQPPSPIVTVVTQRGRTIKTNDRHPFLLHDGRWVEAQNLQSGDRLTTGLGWASDDVADLLTSYEAWVLGVIVGDGCTVSTTPVVSAWDEGIQNRLSVGHELRSTGKGHDYRLLGARSLAVRTGLMGLRSWEKRVPYQVMLGSAKVKSAFLSGLIDTDGHVTSPLLRQSAEVGITSTSHELLRDAQHLLASLGVNSSVSLSMPATRGEKCRDAWRLIALGNDQARQLNEILDLACAEKAQRLAAYAELPSKQDRSRYDRVVSVIIGEPEPTIGIEIAEHHTHVTGGVVTHNTLYLGGGADVTVVGADMHQMDFKVVQGAGETRLAAAAGVGAVMAQFSEGLQGSSLNAGNYGAARRRFADVTMRHLWQDACGALEPLVTVPNGSRLWFDADSIPFLQEDAKDAADIFNVKAQAIRQLVDGGYDPQSVVDAADALDPTLLKHTGKLSVQLQTPGSKDATPALNGASAAN